MRIIITGASGTIGKNFLLYAHKDWEIIALYNKNETFCEFVKEKGLTNVSVVKCNLLCEEEIQNVFQRYEYKFDCCLYLAGNTSVSFSLKYPKKILYTNTVTLLNFLKYWKGKKIIFISSDSIYEGLSGLVSPEIKVNPKFPYAISKLCSEQYLKFYSELKGNEFSYIILRMFGTFGLYDHNDSLCNKLVNTLYFENKNAFTAFGDCKNYVDIMYIEDVIKYIIRFLRNDIEDKTIDLCSGKPVTIEELIKKAAYAFGKKNIKINSTDSENNNYYLQRYYYGSPKLLNSLTDYKPRYSIEDGFIKLVYDISDGKVIL